MTVVDTPQTPAPASRPKERELTPEERRFVAMHLAVAIIALMIGSLMGPLQAFEFSGLDLYPYLEPVIQSYYQGLLVNAHRTRAITESMVIFLIGLVFPLAAGIWLGNWPGLPVTLIALTIGTTAQVAWLAWAWRRCAADHDDDARS